MKFIAGLLAVILCAAQPVGLSQRLSSQADSYDLSTTLESLRAEAQQAVNYWEQKVVGIVRLQRQGMVSEGDVDSVRLQLALVRHDLALMSGDRERMCQEFAQIVKIRSAELTRIQRQWPRGMTYAVELEEAQRRLANAKFHLACRQERFGEAIKQIHQIIALCKVDHQRWVGLQKRDVGAEVQVEHSRRRLAAAEYDLALVESEQLAQVTRQIAQAVPAQALIPVGGPLGIVAQFAIPYSVLELGRTTPPTEGILKQLRIIVELHKTNFRREMRLYNMNALGQEAVDLAHISLLWNQERLARAEQKPQEVVKHLEALVRAMEPWANRRGLSEDELMQRKGELTEARRQLALAREGIGVYQSRLGSLYELDY
jgi:hypothetical protein